MKLTDEQRKIGIKYNIMQLLSIDIRNNRYNELQKIYESLNLTRELKVLNIFKMYFLLCNKDLTKQIRTHGLLLKCKKILDIKSKICGRSRYRRFLEVARAAL